MSLNKLFNTGKAISCAAFLIGIVAVLCVRADYRDERDQVEESGDNEEGR